MCRHLNYSIVLTFLLILSTHGSLTNTTTVLTNTTTVLTNTTTVPPAPFIPEFWLKVKSIEGSELWHPTRFSQNGEDLTLEMNTPHQQDSPKSEFLSLGFSKTHEPIELFVEKWLEERKKEDPGIRSKQGPLESPIAGIIVACESPLEGKMSINRFVQIREGILTLSYRIKSSAASKKSLSEWVTRIKGADLSRSEGRIPESLFEK
jgi:hypothetical protein